MKRYFPLIFVALILLVGSYLSLSRGKLLGSADGILEIVPTSCGRMLASAIHKRGASLPSNHADRISELRAESAELAKADLVSKASIEGDFSVDSSIDSLLVLTKDLIDVSDLLIQGDNGLSKRAAPHIDSEELTAWLAEDRNGLLYAFRNRIVLDMLNLHLYYLSHEKECYSEGNDAYSDSLATGTLDAAETYLNLAPSDPSRAKSEKNLLDNLGLLVHSALNLKYMESAQVTRNFKELFFDALTTRFLKIRLHPLFNGDEIVSAPMEISLLSQISLPASEQTKQSIIESVTRLMRVNLGADGPAARVDYVGFVSLPSHADHIALASMTDEAVLFNTDKDSWILPHVIDIPLKGPQTDIEIEVEASKRVR